MPLPALSEQAAARVESILATLDRRLERYILNGGTPPDPDVIMRDVIAEIDRSIAAALVDIDPDATQADIDRARIAAERRIRDQVENAIGQAVNLRNQYNARARRRRANETVTEWARDVGLVSALIILFRQQRRNRDRATRLARELGVRLPRQLGGYGRMVVRTTTAIRRNDHAADVVDLRNVSRGTPDAPEWALFIEDARLGPTDEPCEVVNRRWATSSWLRQNPVEHPNCTRRGLPRPLPAGARVTLTV